MLDTYMFWDKVARSFEFILNLVIMDEIAQSKVIRVQSGDFHKFMEGIMEILLNHNKGSLMG